MLTHNARDYGAAPADIYSFSNISFLYYELNMEPTATRTAPTNT